jgi:hypothetical protein
MSTTPTTPTTATTADHAADEASETALTLILAAWDDGLDHGIPPERIAYAAIFAALTELVGLYGEDAVGRLVDGLARRVRTGEFTVATQVQ